MPRLGWQGHGLMFASELLAQTAGRDETATALTVGDAIDMDECESANVMGWLAEHRLVRECEHPDGWVDAYTTAPIELTARGRLFVETGEVPTSQVVDVRGGLQRLREHHGGR